MLSEQDQLEMYREKISSLTDSQIADRLGNRDRAKYDELRDGWSASVEDSAGNLGWKIIYHMALFDRQSVDSYVESLYRRMETYIAEHVRFNPELWETVLG